MESLQGVKEYNLLCNRHYFLHQKLALFPNLEIDVNVDTSRPTVACLWSVAVL